MERDAFDSYEYRGYLKNILEENKVLALRLIPRLALRMAVRVLPLLALNGNLNFWVHEKNDRRVEHLAGLLNVVSLLSRGGAFSAANVRRNANAASSAAKATNSSKFVIALATMVANAAATADAAEAIINDAAAIGKAQIGIINRSVGTIEAAIEVAAYANVTIVDSLKMDIQKGQENRAEFEAGSLWWGTVPEFFIEYLRKLAGIVEQLPRSKSAPETWNTINAGLNILWREAGMQLQSSSNPNPNPNPDSDTYVGEVNHSSAGRSWTLFSYLSTNQFHPENPSASDKLNRQKLVNALAVNLAHSANKHHRAIGLLGEWGSGKSTVLKLLKEKLQKSHTEQPFVFGEFNAWAYEHTDNIQAGVAQEMIDALTSLPDQPSTGVSSFWSSIGWLFQRAWLTLQFSVKTHPFEILKILALLLVAAMPWFTDWFNGLINDKDLAIVGQWVWSGGLVLYTLREFGKLIISPQAKELLTYLRLPSYAEHLGKIPVMRKHISTLCELRLKAKKGKTPRLLFVVDDLDRCSPEAIVKVLEAVRLVLDLENVIVLIAIDQHIALAALSKHFNDFALHHKLKNSHAIAREYLSKVINLPIVLTAPSGDDVNIFMVDLWKDMPKASPVGAGDPDQKVPVDNSLAPSSSEMNLPVVDSTLEPDSVPVTDVSPDSDHTEGVKSKATEDDKQVTAKVNPINALSPEQQASFIYWANYFELTNPRQLKRLNNSYDLMRSYLPQWDKEVVEFALTEVDVLKVYPMLLTLILMEYLNSLHSLMERSQLWEKLFSEPVIAGFESAKVGIPRVKVTEINNKRVTSDFVKAYRSLLAAEGNKSLVSNVEAFVLPAMN